MKHAVSDEAVSLWIERLASGGPIGKVFPGPFSECEFSDAQKERIRQARAEKKARQKAGREMPVLPAPNREVPSDTDITVIKPLTKLRKMLYLQSGRCFFCGESLPEADASIEHLQPISKGGARTEENEVVCHKTLNETFGQMDLKRKLEFIIRSSGSFHCPNPRTFV